MKVFYRNLTNNYKCYITKINKNSIFNEILYIYRSQWII